MFLFLILFCFLFLFLLWFLFLFFVLFSILSSLFSLFSLFYSFLFIVLFLFFYFFFFFSFFLFFLLLFLFRVVFACFCKVCVAKAGTVYHTGGTLWTIFQKPNAKENCRSFSRIATCSNSHLQPLAQAATCSHLLRRPLAATCSHLPKQPLGRHLQPLAATWQTLDKAATWQPLAATCSHLQPLAPTCSHLQPLGSHLAATCSSSHLAATCSHSQTLAPSGCSKWLPSGLFFENPIAHLLRPQCKLINIKHVLNSLCEKFSCWSAAGNLC